MGGVLRCETWVVHQGGGVDSVGCGALFLKLLPEMPSKYKIVKNFAHCLFLRVSLWTFEFEVTGKFPEQLFLKYYC